MALIKCPNCGKDVSESAAQCVHCGHQLVMDSSESEREALNTVRCPECGEEVESNSEVCPKCGYPIGEEIRPKNDDSSPVLSEENSSQSLASVQPSKSTAAPAKLNTKTLLMVIAGAVLIIAGLALGYVFSVKQEQARLAAEAEAQRLAEDEAFNQFVDDLNSVSVLMLSGAVEAEELGNITLNVWRSAIFEDSQEAWDEEIRQYYADDFNDALNNLYSDPSVVERVESIEKNRHEVESYYKKLQNPPEGLANAYASFEEMHDAYLSLTRLVTSPSGSYQSFSDNFGNSDVACVEAFEKLQSKIPEKRVAKQETPRQ